MQSFSGQCPALPVDKAERDQLRSDDEAKLCDAGIFQDDSRKDAAVVSNIIVVNGAILGFPAESKII